MKIASFRAIARAALGAALVLSPALSAHAGLINGGFESPVIATSSYVITDQSNVPGWRTTSTDGNIEIWSSGYSSVSGGPVPAYAGQQFAEINATQFATLYQDVSGIAAGSIVGFEFAHRGRAGLDTMRLTITDLGADGLFGGSDDTALFTKDYADGNTAWGFYTSAGESPLVALGNTVRFAYQALSTANGNPTVGNFIDAADFGVGVGQGVPEPSALALVSLAVLGLGFMRGRQA